MPRSANDLAFERLKFALAKEGYTGPEMDALCYLLPDIRNFLLGRVAMRIHPRSLSARAPAIDSGIFSAFSYHDLRLLVLYASSPLSADYLFLRNLLVADASVEVLDAMAELYEGGAQVAPRDDGDHQKEAQILLAYFQVGG